MVLTKTQLNSTKLLSRSWMTNQRRWTNALLWRRISDESKIADCFLDYFSSVANDIGDITLLESNEEQLMSHTNVQRINEYKKVVNGPQFQFESLHCEEITKASKELNVRKGMGHDRIPNSILRLGSEELAPSLTTILIQ